MTEWEWNLFTFIHFTSLPHRICNLQTFHF